MAIARMTRETGKIKTIDVPSDIEELKLYLGGLRGTKVLTFEETTPAHWLYTELKTSVNEIVVCDPYRNRLLSEGAKTDKIDGVPRRPPFLRAKVPPWQLPVWPGSEECTYEG